MEKCPSGDLAIVDIFSLHVLFTGSERESGGSFILFMLSNFLASDWGTGSVGKVGITMRFESATVTLGGGGVCNSSSRFNGVGLDTLISSDK